MKKLILGFSVAATMASAQSLEPLKTKLASIKILTDEKSLTLYVFDKDKEDVSNCYDDCAATWPPLLTTAETLKDPLSVVKRNDGTKQIAFKKRPLYKYDGDAVTSDINGDGLGKIWHVVHP